MKVSIVTQQETLNNFSDTSLKDFENQWSIAKEKLTNYTGDVYAIYSNYEKDYTKDFSFAIGVDKDFSDKYIDIPNQEYKVFKVMNFSTNPVADKWKEIWRLEDEGLLKRAYTLDYEFYSASGMIEIYIAIK